MIEEDGLTMPNVVMLSPGFPLEMAYFTRALAEVGATVIGVGDQPVDVLPTEARAALAHYEHVSLADEEAVIAALQGLSRHARIDQVECLWEPYMVLAARIREVLGPARHDGGADAAVPGQGADEAGAGRGRDPHPATRQHGHDRRDLRCGGADRLPVDHQADRRAPARPTPTGSTRLAELETVLPMIGHVETVSVEEFIEAEEFTYDTICGAGDILYDNVSWYRPAAAAGPLPRVDQPADRRAA